MVNEFKLTVVHFARPTPMQICACAWIYRRSGYTGVYRVYMGIQGIQGIQGTLGYTGYTWIYRVYMGIQGIHEYGHSITII